MKKKINLLRSSFASVDVDRKESETVATGVMNFLHYTLPSAVYSLVMLQHRILFLHLSLSIDALSLQSKTFEININLNIFQLTENRDLNLTESFSK
jgi:hypothetical protein